LGLEKQVMRNLDWRSSKKETLGGGDCGIWCGPPSPGKGIICLQPSCSRSGWT